MKALNRVFEMLDGEVFSGSPIADWLKIRRLLESCDVEEQLASITYKIFRKLTFLMAVALSVKFHFLKQKQNR